MVVGGGDAVGGELQEGWMEADVGAAGKPTEVCGNDFIPVQLEIVPPPITTCTCTPASRLPPPASTRNGLSGTCQVAFWRPEEGQGQH